MACLRGSGESPKRGLNRRKLTPRRQGLARECWSIGRASQFSRYLLETPGSFDQDTNARASAVKLNRNRYSRAFVAI